MNLISKVHAAKPLILNISNFVTPQRVADIESILGASPLMTDTINEIEELVEISQAVVLNIGTITPSQLQLMIKAGIQANSLDIPVILDPVAVNMPFRGQCVKELSKSVHFDFIRGNSAEIAWFTDKKIDSKGIDSLSQDNNITIAQQAAQNTSAVILQSGAVDVISDAKQTVSLHYDNPQLAINVGAGDMLSAVVATFASVTQNKLQSAYTAAMVMSLAGQKTIEYTGSSRLGSYINNFLDALYSLNDIDLKKGEMTWY